MTTFQTVRETTRQFGQQNASYFEVARRRLKDETGKESDFIVATRGFINEQGEKRWTRFVTLPDDPDLKKWLADAILGV